MATAFHTIAAGGPSSSTRFARLRMATASHAIAASGTCLRFRFTGLRMFTASHAIAGAGPSTHTGFAASFGNDWQRQSSIT